jgi:hypothetical protein
MRDVGKTDNRNKRSGIDRREFSYTAYLPERRSGKDRRGVFENRRIPTNESGRKTSEELAKYS